MLKAIFGPVGIVVIVIALVMGVGYWGLADKLWKPVTRPAEDTGAAATTATEPAATPATTPAPATTTTPAPAPSPAATAADANKAILDGRKHIDRAAGATSTSLLTVYYDDGLAGTATLQPVEIRVPATTGVIRATVEQIIAAPTNLKLYSNFPAGTKVKGATISAGVATVDLSAEASSVQGTAAVQNIEASLVYSLTAIRDVKAVRLWVNGRPAVLHGIEWSKPVSRADLDAKGYYKVAPLVKFAQ